MKSGPGISLGTLSSDFMKNVDIPKMLSSEIQGLRDGLQASNPSPALCCSPFVGLVMPRVTADGTLKTVGVVNTRIDVQGPIRIRLDRIPDSAKRIIWHEMKKKPVRIPMERVDGSVYAVIPEIAPWNAGFLTFK